MDRKARDRALSSLLGALSVLFCVLFSAVARLSDGENEILLDIGAILAVLALVTAVLFVFFLIRSRETRGEKWRAAALLLGVVLGYGAILLLLTAEQSALPVAAELGIVFGGLILGTVCSSKLLKISQKDQL